MVTEALVECPCGMYIELHWSRYDNRRLPWWSVYDPKDLPAPLPPEDVVIDEVYRERAAVARFTDEIVCSCGRRYRALRDPTRVEPVE